MVASSYCSYSSLQATDRYSTSKPCILQKAFESRVYKIVLKLSNVFLASKTYVCAKSFKHHYVEMSILFDLVPPTVSEVNTNVVNTKPRSGTIVRCTAQDVKSPLKQCELCFWAI